MYPYPIFLLISHLFVSLNITDVGMQVALDEAAFLLDLASVEGTWDEVIDRVAACYVEAGLHEVAKFVLYRE